MKKMQAVLAAIALSALGSFLAFAQQPAAQAPPQPMSFFITSAGSGDGANLGGLAGADHICQTLAASVGSTKTWHAYLSTQATAGQPAINARDRIGTGPWYNAKGEKIANGLADLHGDTAELARRGNNLVKLSALNEKGEIVNGRGDKPNRHDMLTGSQTDGTAFTDSADHTCSNWTSDTTGTAQLGHSDRNGAGNTSWNSAHPSRGCSQENLVSTGGAGLFYCFAIN
ncbi:MAG TPA: lectin [Candidatus Dormibacteraeota bacterium]|nr:lectin [Candidatus Dormibacteraeota bacterium]